MTATIPNLWEGKFSQHAATPLAVLRTHAGNFNTQSGGMLNAEVEHHVEERDGVRIRMISFEIVAPALDYRFGVFTAEHLERWPYPVTVRSEFLKDPTRVIPRPVNYDSEAHTCLTQVELIKTLDLMTASGGLRTQIESLIAQINEANSDDE